MIDDKINNSLKELENQLKNVEVARTQVEKTINSFDGINISTKKYVYSLNEIKTRLDEIVKLIGQDYNNKVSEFEKDRAEIVKSSNNAINKIEKATNSVRETLVSNANLLQKKLTYTLILNVIIIAAVIAKIFLKL